MNDREAKIADLEKQLTEARAEKEKEKPVVLTDDKTFKALQTENQLMTSAWYDLTSRLQHNNVTIGRRRESPKSWLGKQRAAVGLGSSNMYQV